MDVLAFVLIAAGVLIYGLVSARLERGFITAPMVFVAFGYLISPSGAGLVHFEVGEGATHMLAELTLVLVLFADASRIDVALLRRQHNLPIRLLALSLPLTIVAGGLLGLLLLDGLRFWEVALVAAILAPTDAALGQAVVSHPRVPVRIRQTLNVESGLNDGIVLPVVLIFLALAGMAGESQSVSEWLQFVGKQLIFGPLVGIAIGYLGGKAVTAASASGWMSHSFQSLAALGLSILAFGSAELVGGNGFIAAFFAGLTLGNTSRSICTCLHDFAEAEGQLLTLLVFMIFGAEMVPAVLAHATVEHWIYAGLSLTVIRMVPTALGLVGSGLRPSSVAFIGWFGPRGLASILFALLVVEGMELPGTETITIVVMTTVLISVFAHGLTANPLATRYAVHLERLEPHECPQERKEVAELPVRHRHAKVVAPTPGESAPR